MTAGACIRRLVDRLAVKLNDEINVATADIRARHHDKRAALQMRCARDTGHAWMIVRDGNQGKGVASASRCIHCDAERSAP
jgi:hypothetical protein